MKISVSFVYFSTSIFSRDWKKLQYLESGWVVLNGTALSKENDQMSQSLGQNTFGRNKDVFNSELFVKLGTTVPLGTTGPFHSDRFFPWQWYRLLWLQKTPMTSQIRDQKFSGKFVISSVMSLVVMRKRAIDDFSTFKPVPRIQKRSKCFLHSFFLF